MIALAVVTAATPALAAKRPVADSGRAYVIARAAELSGDHNRSAMILAQLAEGDASSMSLSRRAASQAISAGAMALALKLGRRMPITAQTTDVRLLLAADELVRGRTDRALPYLEGQGEDGDLSFIAPYIRAWNAADRNNLAEALTILEQIPVNSLLGNYVNEQRAYILLRFKMTQDAEAFARRAIGQGGRREARIRLAMADGFLAAGDKARALGLLDSPTVEAISARKRVESGKSLGTAIDSSAKAFSTMLVGLSLDLSRINGTAFPIRLVQVARYASPTDSAATIVLGAMLQSRDRTDEALATFRMVKGEDFFAGEARDAEVRALTETKQYGDALQIAQGLATRPGANATDFSRLGDVLSTMKRYREAADAYGRAFAMASALAPADRWPLLLLKASSLEAADQWPEAKRDLEAALQLAPDQPLILNFLGYAKLERGEDLDNAEAMIRKASELAPDDASITDSLGWAQYKRGRVAESIETLQRAAAADPGQAEIREHLGDALYDAGRKYEARFAWESALISADEEIAARVRAKLQSGLNKANKAP